MASLISRMRTLGRSGVDKSSALENAINGAKVFWEQFKPLQ